ncbi:uncharacterized protein LOC130369424 [Hyla sarda]|uniref:uncharacterized protein LOC130369424 n=1 Tax=Hyla sarda TaxID=327740 RepID=UPI0024C3F88E|nr:uncharacterized protein LOC130369424 [Hyla sarda]
MSEENKTPSEIVLPENLQSLVDASISKSINVAVQSAVSALQGSIDKSVSLAIARSNSSNMGSIPPLTPSDQFWSPEESVSQLAKGLKGPGKAKAKRRHSTDGPYSARQGKNTSGVRQDLSHSQNAEFTQASGTGGSHKPQDIPSTREEAQSSRVKKSSFRAKPNSFKVSSSEESADSDIGDIDEILYVSEDSDANHDDPGSQEETNLTESGDTYFDPALICHPRSGEWLPKTKVAEFISQWANKPLDKPSRNKLKAECPRPTLPNNASHTPELDPLIAKFLFKTGNNPKKGVDRSFKSCQDKLMDLLGPLTKILNLAEEASTSDTQVDPETLKGWAQRAICIFGNANASLSNERKRSILLKIDPQLTNLATVEPPNPTKGMLFGDDFIKELNKYVGLFSSLNKAQVSMKKVFSQRVFGKAGRGRGRSSGRSSQSQYHRGSYSHTSQSSGHSSAPPPPFFPYRGRPWRARGHRGFPRSRPPTAPQ